MSNQARQAFRSRAASDLVIDLEDLVLEGFSPHQAARLAAAIGPALARELARRGMPRDARVARSRTPLEVNVDRRESAAGASIARAVYERVAGSDASTGTGGRPA